MEDVVYFELFDLYKLPYYPREFPFLWCTPEFLPVFLDDAFLKENQLCVVIQTFRYPLAKYGYGFDWCITAPKWFVDKYCPKLLTDERYMETDIHCSFPYSNLLRFPDEDGIVYGSYGVQFKPWVPEEIGKITDLGVKMWRMTDVRLNLPKKKVEAD